MSKVLANRLKRVLPAVIDDSQSAFLSGRGLLDSVVVANEWAHEAKSFKKQSMAFKVDFEKAYDSVRWDFLYYMLRRLNFGDQWITWIKGCLESARVSVLINGSPSDEFSMSLGLRQGDPIAPFLFLIVAEGLNGLLRRAVSIGCFTGYRFKGLEEEEVSILQFADDTLFLGAATRQNAFTVKCILHCFELASGLKVNFSKSSLIGVAVDTGELQVLAAILNCRVQLLPFTYLGLQIGGNPRRVSFWNPVLNKLRSRLTRWRRKSLSFGGRVCLINSTLSSIPIFYLSFFKMPCAVAIDCSRIMRRFLWGDSESEHHNKIAWVNWNAVCKPKELGGLGVKDWGAFNKALLGKWRWRLSMDNPGLWCRIIKAKYGGPNGDWVIPRTAKASPWWCDIRKSCFEDPGGTWLSKSISKRLGDGSDTRFWLDLWVGDVPLAVRFAGLYNLSLQQSGLVSDMGFWQADSWSWLIPWRRAPRDWEKHLVDELYLLLNQVELKLSTSDEWRWNPDPNAGYSVRSAYCVLRGLEDVPPVPVFNQVWRTWVPSNTKAFVWRLLWGRVQTKLNLFNRGVHFSTVDLLCPFCKRENESLEHLFFLCPSVLKVWYNCYNWLGVSSVLPRDCWSHFLQHAHGCWNPNQQRVWWSIWCAMVWTIWVLRNNLVFRNLEPDWSNVLDLVKWKAWVWISAKVKEFCCSHFEWVMNPRVCISQV